MAVLRKTLTSSNVRLSGFKLDYSTEAPPAPPYAVLRTAGNGENIYHSCASKTTLRVCSCCAVSSTATSNVVATSGQTTFALVYLN